ncbi:MAG: 23S rRNA (pseudouridine(1915)-N(3))-methyltransferase RlmH [Desulfurobacteriaceae bacterium]
MKLRVVAVGKIAPHLSEAQNYYLKRVRGLEVLEVKKGRSKEEEGRKLLSRAVGFVVALDEMGKELNSREFASLLSKHSRVTFLVGGADGLSGEVKEKADLLLSLSKLTLQHDVARLVLLEQLFRAQEINRGSPYHRG